MPSTGAAFPRLRVKAGAEATVQAVLPGHIYTIDGLLDPAECGQVLKWAKSLQLEAPKPAKRDEAERTAFRASVQSPEIATALLPLLQPYLTSLDPKPDRPSLLANIRVYHYPTHTYFRGHYDTPFLDPTTRRLTGWTVLIYLSEGVQGGGTTFNLPSSSPARSKKAAGKNKGATEKAAASITIDPKAGRCLIHWHGATKGGCMLHEGDEVLGGDKWVLRTDIVI